MAFLGREQSVPSPSSRSCNSTLCAWFALPEMWLRAHFDLFGLRVYQAIRTEVERRKSSSGVLS
jgi:hypothetical protein